MVLDNTTTTNLLVQEQCNVFTSLTCQNARKHVESKLLWNIKRLFAGRGRPESRISSTPERIKNRLVFSWISGFQKMIWMHDLLMRMQCQKNSDPFTVLILSFPQVHDAQKQIAKEKKKLCSLRPSGKWEKNIFIV